MGVYVKGMEMPMNCDMCIYSAWSNYFQVYVCDAIRESEPVLFGGKQVNIIDIVRGGRADNCPLVPVPPHGDLIDRDALIKDGWHNLHKEVMRMGGYEIYELPLKNPSIAVIIPAEEGET